MAKNDNHLFERLRRAGVRKQVAKTLSGIGEDASKTAVRAAQERGPRVALARRRDRAPAPEHTGITLRTS